MKKLLILAILISGLAKAQTFDFSCTASDLKAYDLLVASNKTVERDNIIAKFVEEGAKRGVNVVFQGGTYTNQHGHKFPGWQTWNDGNIGVAWSGCGSQRTKWVRFWSQWWDWSSTWIAHKTLVVFHELGHSYLNLSHKSGTIMHATLNTGSKNPVSQYTTNGKLNAKFFDAVDDLFNNYNTFCGNNNWSNSSKSAPSEGEIICNFVMN